MFTFQGHPPSVLWLSVLLVTVACAACGDQDRPDPATAPDAGGATTHQLRPGEFLPAAALPVATTVFQAVDRQRPEPGTAAPFDHRTLVIRAFHPSGGGTFPVILFSAGQDADAGDQWAPQLEALASRGFAVFAIAHPFTSGAAEGAGRAQAVATMSADQRFVLSVIEALNGPASSHVLRGRLDVGRVGVYGQALGGDTATQTCHDDPWFRACARVNAGPDADPGLRAAISQPFFSADGADAAAVIGFFAANLQADAKEEARR